MLSNMAFDQLCFTLDKGWSNDSDFLYNFILQGSKKTHRLPSQSKLEIECDQFVDPQMKRS
jgi:hypothetical protein